MFVAALGSLAVTIKISPGVSVASGDAV